MMNMTTALALLMLIPAIIATVQEGKDNAVKTLSGILIGLSVLISLDEFVPFVDDMLEGVWWKILGVACAILGVILVVRLRNRVIGTLIVTGSGLLCLGMLDVIRAGLDH
jgi:hypothetical protein